MTCAGSVIVCGQTSDEERHSEVVDLKFRQNRYNAHLETKKQYSQRRPLRRDKKRVIDTQQYNEFLNPNYKNSGISGVSEFAYITGLKYVFQLFIRQYPVGALIVWIVLFLVEIAMVGISIAHSFEGATSWKYYDKTDKSAWFYARLSLSVISLLQLFFAYSLSPLTIFVVITTSIYQILIALVAFFSSWPWVSRMYVPLFLRCWPMRQYLLLIIDSVSSMTTPNRKLDLFQIAAGPLTLFVCMVCTGASVFHLEQSLNGHHLNFVEALYFTVVTVSTVGFGDVYPKTGVGKVIVIVIIIMFLSKMPTFIHVIRSTIKFLRVYCSYKGRRKHFIVYGLVTREEAISILDEVFCLYPMKAVCFCNTEFAEEVLSIGRHPSYRMRATFLVVETLDIFAFRRMRATEAGAVFIFPAKAGYSSRVDDDVMLISLTFGQFAPNLAQYCSFCYGLHARLLQGNHTLLINEFMQKNIMATALLLPGIVPFLVNLVRNAWAEGKEPDNLWTEDGMDDWKSQYEYSRRNVISMFPVPSCFIGWKMMNVVSIFKSYDVLIVGLIENERKVMYLNLDYVIVKDDVLAAIYEHQHDSMAVALELFNQYDELEEMKEGDNDKPHFRTFKGGKVANQSTRQSTVVRQFSNTFSDQQNSQVKNQRSKGFTRDSRDEGVSVSKEEIHFRLQKLEFVPKALCGVSVSSLQFGVQDLHCLNTLINEYEDALSKPYTSETRRDNTLNGLEKQFISYLKELAHEHASAIADFTVNTQQEVVFLFIDQASSIHRKTSISIYEDIISQAIAQYELYVMMQCICSVHPRSQLRLLTLRKYPTEYFKFWEHVFSKPLCCIQGQGIIESHLHYSLFEGQHKPPRVHGILVYCSQMGPRDFGDIPLSSVMNNVLNLLELNSSRSERLEDVPEQNVMIELESFLTSIKVAPFHTDLEWRQRGERNFQDSLAFMMGRCFSSNMLQTLLIHSYREHRINTFFNMVLNLTSTADIFNPSMWAVQVPLTQTLFRLCGNRTLQFEKFEDAFNFLLKNRRCVAIGVFRIFPASEYLKCNARYFVTNPPLCMPLSVDDIIYCLDGKTGVFASC